HARARLFMKDVQASREMVIDDDGDRDVAKRNALYDTPVTDFDLSVRARNCLKKMNIRTLGDLLRVSEAELLGYRNLGEATLIEIKQMLAARGLRLGQRVDERRRQSRRELFQSLQGGGEGALGKPVSDIDFSVRVRKALQLLGVQTLGDLAARTEAELMGVKNFGATSLTEVHQKLSAHGLQLRQLDFYAPRSRFVLHRRRVHDWTRRRRFGIIRAYDTPPPTPRTDATRPPPPDGRPGRARRAVRARPAGVRLHGHFVRRVLAG